MSREAEHTNMQTSVTPPSAARRSLNNIDYPIKGFPTLTAMAVATEFHRSFPFE